MWTISKRLVCLLSLAAALLLVGCAEQHQNQAMNRKELTQVNQGFSPDRISFADNMDVLVTDVRTTWEGPFLKVMFELMNRKNGDETRPVYQIEWLDKTGYPKEVTSWKPLLIKGNQKVKVVEMTSRQDVVDYKITISKKEN